MSPHHSDDRPADIVSGDEARAAASPLLREPLFRPRPARRYDAAVAGWVPAPAETPSFVRQESALRVLTWNVLFDRYDCDRIETARRHPLLIRALAESDADVIALQEVERPFARRLLAEDWVRARYVASDGPRGDTLVPYGVLLLSRLPVVELAWHELDEHKKVAAMVVAAADRPVVIATVHLTSDHAKDGAKKRAGQLATLRDSLAAAGDADVIALGDFNEDGDLPARALAMRDAWTEANGDPLPTFDPPNNPMARVASVTGAPLRLDRVLLRTRADVELERVARIGTEPATEDGLFVSDHYGLIADLRVGAERSASR